jgi:hypothetical protein
MTTFTRLALIVVVSICTLNIFPIAIKNDLPLLIDADPQYSGFKEAKVYIQGKSVPFNHTINTCSKNGCYSIEIKIPADYAARLAGKELSSFSQKILSLLRCYLHITYKPENNDETHYLTDILIEKTTNARYTVYPRGILSITVYVEN